MTEIAVRVGTPADVDAMYALDLLCFDAPFRFDLRSMRGYATHAEAIVLIAEADGAMCGFIVVNAARRRSLHAAYITTLDVHPDFRRMGVARALLAEAERKAAEAGAGSMQLHVYTGNIPAIRFYETAGYEQLMLIEDFYSDGLSAFAYVKPL